MPSPVGEKEGRRNGAFVSHFLPLYCRTEGNFGSARRHSRNRLQAGHLFSPDANFYCLLRLPFFCSLPGFGTGASSSPFPTPPPQEKSNLLRNSGHVHAEFYTTEMQENIWARLREITCMPEHESRNLAHIFSCISVEFPPFATAPASREGELEFN